MLFARIILMFRYKLNAIKLIVGLKIKNVIFRFLIFQIVIDNPTFYSWFRLK